MQKKKFFIVKISCILSANIDYRIKQIVKKNPLFIFFFCILRF